MLFYLNNFIIDGPFLIFYLSIFNFIICLGIFLNKTNYELMYIYILFELLNSTCIIFFLFLGFLNGDLFIDFFILTCLICFAGEAAIFLSLYFFYKIL